LNPRRGLLRSPAVVRLRILLFTAVLISGILGTLLHGQQSDEVKQKPVEIRKASAASSPSASPDESPTPKKKSTKKKASPSPTAKAKTKPKHSETPDAEESSTPAPRKKKTSSATAKPGETPAAADDRESKAEKSATPKAKPKSGKKKTTGKKAEPSPAKKSKRKPSAEDEENTGASKQSLKPSETPEARPAVPRASAVPTPSAPPEPRSTITSSTPVEEPEQLTIEKYGYEKPRGFWARVFGGGGRRSSSGAGYRYLTRAVRAEIDRAPADRRTPRWQMIVVHNSGTRQGNARVFDYYHRHVRHMQNGLAYHFVIGNGTSTGNGQIEVGDRWRRQINGGHVHSDYLNNIALGICLVGDFNRDQPTRAQLDCCEELIRYLRQRCGRFDNSHFPVVKPHREANPPRWGTDCPGDAFPYSWFRRFRE
jgi:hypothetical protein